MVGFRSRAAPRPAFRRPGAQRTGASVLSLALCLLVSGPALARASDGGDDAKATKAKDWSVTIAPYLWVAGLDGSLTAPLGGSISGSQSFSQLASNLDAGFAGVISIRYERLQVFSDNSWIKLSQSIARTGLVVRQADVTLETAFGTAAVAYTLPLDWPAEIDLYLGGRWWHNSADVTLLGAPGIIAAGSGEAVWGDAVGGARLLYRIAPGWRVALMGDVGGGESDLTWMVTGNLIWMFSDHVGTSFAYRVLGVDYTSQGWTYDVKQQGFILGLVLEF